MQPSLLRYAGSLAARGMEAVGKFGLYILAARLMGAQESGLFFLCLTWVNLVSTAARMGLERAMARHIATELATGRGGEARRVLLVGLFWTLLASVAAAVITFVVAQPASSLLFHQPDMQLPLQIAALILPPQTVAFAMGFALIGLNRGVSGQIVQSALPPVLSLAALVIGLDHLNTLLLAYACSYSICCVIGAILLLREWRLTMTDQPDSSGASHEALPSLFHTARPFLLIELAQSLLLSIPVLVLGMFSDPASVSAFSIALRLTNLINTVLLSIAMIAAPAFARHHRRNEYIELRQVNRHTSFLAMALCLPIIVIMMVYPRTFLLLLGPEFAMATGALVVLTIGQLVNVLLPTQDTILAMTGHGKILLRLNLQQLLVCCLLAFVLVPSFGLIGASWLSTLSLIQGRISFAWAVRRVLPEMFAKATRVPA